MKRWLRQHPGSWITGVVAAIGRGWPGRSCPECDVNPGVDHRDDCLIGAWDSGPWS